MVVLGQVAVRREDGTEVPLGGSRQQRVLAALVAAREPLTRAALLHEAWSADTAASAGPSLSVALTRLRKTLGPDAIVTRGGTLHLALDVDAVDAWSFDGLASDVAGLASRQEWPLVLERAEAALVAWSADEPFHGAAAGPLVERERSRLLSLRRAVRLARAEATSATGRPEQAAADLRPLLDEAPHDEPLHVVAAKALRDAGQVAEALATLDRLRSALRDDLGLDLPPHAEELRRALLGSASLASPAAPATYIGREIDLAALEVALEQGRLVTIVGFGGMGKTRTARELILRGALGEHHVFLELAPLRTVDEAWAALATALGIPDVATGARDAVRTAVAPRGVVVVLDNCEHLTEARRLAKELLEAGPHVRVLATSRSALALDVEHVHRLEPLSALAQDGAGRSPARALLEQARRRHGLAASSDPALDALCAAVDGVPLALELAAAALRALSPGEVVDRISGEVSLPGPQRDRPARHRSTHDLVAWSYQLLDKHDATLLRALSACPGDANLHLAAAVDGGGPVEVLDGLLRLIDASLVVPRNTPAGTRYGMLELVRSFAVATCSEAERTAFARRHAEHVLRLGAVSPTATRQEQLAYEHDVRAAGPSLRAAVRWLRDNDRVRLADLSSSHAELLGEGGRYAEAIEITQAVLDAPCGPTVEQVRNAFVQGLAQSMRGDEDERTESWQRMLLLARALADPEMLLLAISTALYTATSRDELRELAAEGDSLLQALPPAPRALPRWLLLDHWHSDLAGALRFTDPARALSAADQLCRRDPSSHSLLRQATLLLDQGRPEEAEPFLSRYETPPWPADRRANRIPVALLQASRMRAQFGDTSLAVRHARASLMEFDRLGIGGRGVDCELLLCDLATERSDLDAAGEHLRQAVARAGQAADASLVARIAWRRVDLLRRRGARPEAISQVPRVEALLKPHELIALPDVLAFGVVRLELGLPVDLQQLTTWKGPLLLPAGLGALLP